MKNVILYLCVIGLLPFTSCKKEDTPSNRESLIKLISFDSEMATVACFETADDNLVLVGRSLDNATAGWIVKLNQAGDTLWRKRMSSLNRVLWKAISIQGGGFVTVGYEEDFGSVINFCKYDDDGNLLSSNSDSLSGYAINLSPADIIQLKNGNCTCIQYQRIGQRPCFDH